MSGEGMVIRQSLPGGETAVFFCGRSVWSGEARIAAVK